MSSQSDLRVPRLDADRRADDPGVIRASDRLRCLFAVDGASSSKSEAAAEASPLSSASSSSASASTSGSICRLDGVGVGGASEEVGERDRDLRQGCQMAKIDPFLSLERKRSNFAA